MYAKHTQRLFMKRINFYLTESEILNLQEGSSEKGISASDLLRRILDNYFEEERPEVICRYGNVPISGNFVYSGNSLVIL